MFGSRTLQRLVSILTLAILMLAGVSSLGATATTWTVTKTADTNDGACDSDCSLREAIAAAASGDTIVFDASLSGGTITLGGVLTLSKSVTIDGSALAASITLDGVNAYRVFYVNSDVTATLNHLTITRGNAGSGFFGGGLVNYGVLTVTNCIFTASTAYYGGGLHNQGTTTVTNCFFSANTTRAGGGGLRNNGTIIVTDSTFSGNSGGTGWGGGIASWGSGLTVSNSTFSGNSTGDCGGGIYQQGGAPTVMDSTFSNNTGAAAGGGICNHYGNMTVRNSTFSGNSARSAGGIYNNAGTIRVGNCTFSDNSATGSGSEGGGGGFGNAGQGTLNNCTFSGNSAFLGGGLWNGTYGGRVLHFANNIIANSVTGGDCYDTGTIVTNLNNLVEDGSCSTNGVNFKTGDPLLAALADNGGPTQTFALLSGSPAINAGDNTTCAAAPVSGEDQRGEDRNDAQCDIGAFELKNQPPSVSAGGPYSVDEGGTVLVQATGDDPEGQILAYAWDLDHDGVFETPGQNVSFQAGSLDGPSTYTIAVQAIDPGGLSASADATVTVANIAPDVEAGADQTVQRGAAVALSGAWSDPAGALDAPYAWSWDLDGDGAADLSGTAEYGAALDATTSFDQEGSYTMTLAVQDKEAATGQDTLTVTVLNQAPVCAGAAASPALLWPANHKFVPIDVLGVTDPDGDPLTVTITGIRQDEPVDTEGDGGFAPDGRGVGASQAEVRAERIAAKGSDGRAYHIGFRAVDGHGGACQGEVIVTVPFSQAKPAVDGGPLYDSTAIAP